jgi:hypothetical protein
MGYCRLIAETSMAGWNSWRDDRKSEECADGLSLKTIIKVFTRSKGNKGTELYSKFDLTRVGGFCGRTTVILTSMRLDYARKKLLTASNGVYVGE